MSSEAFPLTIWLTSKTAPTTSALAAGDGVHADEAASLHDYMTGKTTASEAATQITALILASSPPAELYRLWGLLAEALVELPEHRSTVLDLLAAIQTLGSTDSTPQIDWAVLPGFGHMWTDLYRLHLHGSAAWEAEVRDEERTAELRGHLENVGEVEAEMYLRGTHGVTVDWALGVLNLVCGRRKGLDCLVWEIHAWLTIAGQELAAEVKQRKGEEIRFGRTVEGGRKGELEAVSASLRLHWDTWREKLRQVRDGDEFDEEARKRAGECFAWMKLDSC